MIYNVYYGPLYYEDHVIKTEDRKMHSGYSYSECPVWGHMFDRTFIGYSPIDFQLIVNDDNIEYSVNEDEPVRISSEDIDENGEYNDNFLYFDVSDLEKEQPVIQLSFTNSYIWTDFEIEHLWFEFLDHPFTHSSNNYVTIGGWFNIANHPRTSSLAIKISNPEEPVIIKKNDPLYRIRFYTDNMDDKPNLIRKKVSDKEIEAMNLRREIIAKDRKFQKEILFNKNIRKQCPFHDV